MEMRSHREGPPVYLPDSGPSWYIFPGWGLLVWSRGICPWEICWCLSSPNPTQSSSKGEKLGRNCEAQSSQSRDGTWSHPKDSLVVGMDTQTDQSPEAEGGGTGGLGASGEGELWPEGEAGLLKRKWKGLRHET